MARASGGRGPRSRAERWLIVGEDRQLFPAGWVAERARGMTVVLRHERTGEQREFLDLIGGYGSNNLGHGNRRVTRALTSQLGRMDHMSALPNGPAAELARRLVRMCGFRRGRAYFVVGGSQAVEVALRLARWRRRRPGVAVLTGAFHGYGAETILLSRDYVDPQLLAQLPAARDVTFLQTDSDDAFAQLEAAAPSTAALLFEPVQGAAGFRAPGRDWLRALLQRAAGLGMLVLADEIQVGLGRTGTMLAIEHALASRQDRRRLLDGVLLSKSLAGGAHGLSAIVLNGERWPGLDSLDEEGALGETFTNSAPGCAAALAVLDQLEADDCALLVESRRKGEFLLDGLRRAQAAASPGHRPEGIRGLGLAIALDFADKTAAGAFSSRAWAEGLLCYVAGGRRYPCVKLIPALNMTWRQTREVLARLERVMQA